MNRKLTAILARMQESPENVRFSELCRICEYYFGPARQEGTSHRIYKTPWTGDPRINIQNDKGRAKAYQVRQVLTAIDKMEAKNGPEE